MMTRQGLGKAIGFGSAGLVLLLLARNEVGRYFEPGGFFVDVMLPRYVTLPAFLLSSAAAAAAALRTNRGRLPTVLVVSAAALAVGVLADRRISFSWEEKILIDGYGPFSATYRGVDSETACVGAGTLSFRVIDGERSFDLFRGIPPLRFAADAVTSRLALEPCGSALNSS